MNKLLEMGNGMRYILGIDGGNSKTHALIVDEYGVPSGFGQSGASDYQEVGIDQAEQAWSMAIHQAVNQAEIRAHEITDACFCLAGADLPEDHVLLQRTADQFLPQARVRVKNDTIASLRAGLYESSFGVTVVVGTGFNAAGRGHRGQEIVMPGLGYISGDYGGGRWLGRQVIRAVMRAWDGRGPKTTLSGLVLDQMGICDEQELIRFLRGAPDVQGRLLDLVPLVFEAAYQGDAVASSFLVALGEEVGLTASVLIHRLGLENEPVPVVLSTSVFRGKGPLLMEVTTNFIHRTAPLARVVIPEFLPVIGAVLEALDDANITLESTVFENIRHGILDRFPTLIRLQGAGEFQGEV